MLLQTEKKKLGYMLQEVHQQGQDFIKRELQNI